MNYKLFTRCAIGGAICGAAVWSFLAIPDFYNEYRVKKNLAPSAVYVTGDNHNAYMLNSDLDSDGYLESILYFRTDKGSDSRLIEIDQNNQLVLRKYKFENNKIVKLD